MSSPLTIRQVPLGVVTQETGLPKTNDDNFAGTKLAVTQPKGQALKELLERLRSTHELYDAYLPLWTYYLDAFEGGPSVLQKEYIHKHQREANEDYEDRIKRAHYTNYCEPLTTFFTDFIFTETIHRDGGTKSDFLTQFLTNVNKKGDDITAFMKEVCDDMQIFGMVYGLVDMPPKPDKAVVTRADEKAFNLQPYWLLIRPNEILDWTVDDFDTYTYLKRCQKVYELKNGVKVEVERYTEWTPETVTVTDVWRPDNKGKEVATQVVRDNEMGKIAVKVARYKRSKEAPIMGQSFLRDLATDNFAVLNLTSLQDEFLYRQCFNILALEMETDLPKADQEDGASGTSNVLIYPKGANTPQYIAPQATPADKIAEERRTIVAEMYRRAAQDTVNELFNGGGSSGFSKAQSFRTTVPRIANRAEILEKFEIEMFTLTYEYMGAQWDGKIAYKDHYEITNLSDALAQMQTLFSELLIPSETFAREEMLRMVSLFDGKIAPDKLAQVRNEIKNANFTEWMDTMKLHFLGRAAESPDVGTALGQPPAPVPGTSSAMATPGKDTPTAPSTAKKPTLTNTQAAKTSAK